MLVFPGEVNFTRLCRNGPPAARRREAEKKEEKGEKKAAEQSKSAFRINEDEEDKGS